MFSKEELNDWLVKIGSNIGKPTKIYMIGGCALSFKELKDVTKDIDIIAISKKDFDAFDEAVKEAGFELKTDLKDEFYLTALAVYTKGDDSRIDVFLKQVGKMLYFTESMMKRAEIYKGYGKLRVYLASSEDIFLFKCMASRPGDIQDCDRLMRRGIDYDVIYDEMTEQSKEEGRRWFFWIYGSLCRLENYNSIPTVLKNKVFQLIKKHWKARPDDFMEDIENTDKHIPDKRLLKELKKS